MISLDLIGKPISKAEETGNSTPNKIVQEEEAVVDGVIPTKEILLIFLEIAITLISSICFLVAVEVIFVKMDIVIFQQESILEESLSNFRDLIDFYKNLTTLL